MNSKGDRASPWKIPLWIFVSAKILPPIINFTLQVFMVFSMKFMTSSDILYVLSLFIIQLYGTISYVSRDGSRRRGGGNDTPPPPLN